MLKTILVAIVFPFLLLAQTPTQKQNAHNKIAFLPEERLKPFYHGVASGDPLSDRVIIWTRLTPIIDAPTPVQWRVATDTSLKNIVAKGETTANADHDYCVKVDVQGLQPNTTYYYGFSALNANSLTGRTKTLPVGDYSHARIGVVSCSNYQSGYFNVYGRLAERNDLDVVLHLGDFLYEYAADTVGGDVNWVVKNDRIPQPNKELLTLNDYQTRYALYRLDPDTRRVHQQHPFICVWDDHEFANDAWTDGAQNHQPDEGSWELRKSRAKQAYYNWIPIRENSDTTIHRAFSIGNLVDLLMLDTRIEGRNKQVYNLGDTAPQESKDSLNDPNRTMLGKPQYQWLTTSLKNSTASWRLLGNQVMFSPVITSPLDTVGMSQSTKVLLPIAEPQLKDRFAGDLWSNYPAEQNNVMKFIQDNSIANVLIATGDFHCAFAYDVTNDPKNYKGSGAVATEFLTPSITADNFDEYLYHPSLPDNLKSLEPVIVAAAPELLHSLYSTLQKNNPHLKWVDLEHNGYVILDITPERSQGDWFFVDTVLVHTTKEAFIRGYFTLRGENKLQLSTQSAPLKSQQQIPAPDSPPQFIVAVDEHPSNEPESAIVLLSLYPLPVTSSASLTYSLQKAQHLKVTVVDIRGKEVETVFEANQDAGVYSLGVDCKNLAPGSYFFRLQSDISELMRAFVVNH